MKLEDLIGGFSAYYDLETGEYHGHRMLEPLARRARDVHNLMISLEQDDLSTYLLQNERRYLTGGQLADPEHELIGITDLRRFGAAGVNTVLNILNKKNGQVEDLNLTAIDPLQLLYANKGDLYIVNLHERIHALGVHTEEAYGIARRFLDQKAVQMLNNPETRDIGLMYHNLARRAAVMEHNYTGDRNIVLESQNLLDEQRQLTKRNRYEVLREYLRPQRALRNGI